MHYHMTRRTVRTSILTVSVLRLIKRKGRAIFRPRRPFDFSNDLEEILRLLCPPLAPARQSRQTGAQQQKGGRFRNGGICRPWCEGCADRSECRVICTSVRRTILCSPASIVMQNGGSYKCGSGREAGNRGAWCRGCRTCKVPGEIGSTRNIRRDRSGRCKQITIFGFPFRPTSTCVAVVGL